MESDKIAENSAEELTIQPIHTLGKVGRWLAAVLLIFGILLGSSWLSLLTMTDLPEEDTRSKLYANYSPWEYVSFQPVDLAIVDAIEQDRGDNINLNDPDEAPEGDWFWETPTPEGETPLEATRTPAATGEQAATNTPAATSTPAAPSSTAIITPSATSTPINTPIPTATNTTVPTNVPPPTNTNVPPPTNTNVPPPTNTTVPTNVPPPTATLPPKPTKTPPGASQCAKIAFNPLSTTATRFRLNIKNNTGAPITIESLTFGWPAANGQLTTILLGSSTIWSGLAAPSSISIGPGDWTGGDLSIDTAKVLAFEFDTGAEKKGYNLTINFVGGCKKSASN